MGAVNDGSCERWERLTSIRLLAMLRRHVCVVHRFFTRVQRGAQLESSVQCRLPRRRRVECEAAVDFEERLEHGRVVAVLDDELEERDARPRVARVDDGGVAVGDESEGPEQLHRVGDVWDVGSEMWGESGCGA